MMLKFRRVWVMVNCRGCISTRKAIDYFKGPYLNDVYTIFSIFDPLPPWLYSGQILSTKSMLPPLLRLHLGNPLPLSV